MLCSIIVECVLKEYLIFDFKEDNISVSVADEDDVEAQLTATLVYEVFNICNTGIRTARSQERLERLQEQMNILITALDKYKENPRNKSINQLLEH